MQNNTLKRLINTDRSCLYFAGCRCSYHQPSLCHSSCRYSLNGGLPRWCGPHTAVSAGNQDGGCLRRQRVYNHWGALKSFKAQQNVNYVYWRGLSCVHTGIEFTVPSCRPSQLCVAMFLATLTTATSSAAMAPTPTSCPLTSTALHSAAPPPRYALISYCQNCQHHSVATCHSLYRNCQN